MLQVVQKSAIGMAGTAAGAAVFLEGTSGDSLAADIAAQFACAVVSEKD